MNKKIENKKQYEKRYLTFWYKRNVVLQVEKPLAQAVDVFPKRFLSWGFKTLFASASSCQCKPPHFSSPAGLCPVNLDQPRSSGRTRFWLSCSALHCVQFYSRDSAEIWFSLHRALGRGKMGWFYEGTMRRIRGAMRPKMAIFKEENDVCTGPKILDGDKRGFARAVGW